MIKLVDINSSNWGKIIRLTTNEDGKLTLGEKYVASNAYSMVQSFFEENWIIKGIALEDDTLIGFTMYGYDSEEDLYEICRFMIDRQYQGKGYGKAALKVIVEELKKSAEGKDIYLSTSPENSRGRHIYESFGFESTGRIEYDELIYKLAK